MTQIPRLGPLQNRVKSNIERRVKKEVDDIGEIVEIPVPFPIWVRPVAANSTPMCTVLEYAYGLVQEWTQNHPDNYPPVVINVSDGMATDGDPTQIAYELCQTGTSDGQTLLFNVHLTDLYNHPIYYPASESELPNDRAAHSLFAMSSLIPESSTELLQQMLGNRYVSQGTRGFIFNGDAASIRHMFQFATVPATKLLDLDR